MYVQRNIEARKRNHFCRGKAVSNTNSECVFVVLVFKHAMCMRYFVVCSLSGSTIYFHIIS